MAANRHEGAPTSAPEQPNSHVTDFDIALPGSQPVGALSSSALSYIKADKLEVISESNAHTCSSGCHSAWV